MRYATAALLAALEGKINILLGMTQSRHYKEGDQGGGGAGALGHFKSIFSH
jgi:hypothetical protein